MISVIVTGSNDGKGLARLLTGLVPAAAEGLVKEVAVLGGDEASQAVAEDAGAELYGADGFGEAIGKARGDWLAGFPLGVNFAPAWMELLATHLARGVSEPARLTARPGGGFSLSAAPEGWLVPRRLAASAAVVEQDFERLARRSGRRLRILDRR
jgi:hypothetical protein